MKNLLRKNKTFFALLVVLLVSTVAFGAERYPVRSLNNIVFSSAGGGTDVMNRYLASKLEQKFKQRMIVSNMPGGLGGTAVEYVWVQKHDGYTVLGCSESITTFLVNNATKHGVSDWHFFIAAGSPGVIAVDARSPYNTIEDFIKAAAKNPGKIKIANSGKGKLWNIKAAILERNAGVKFMHVPYNGSNSAIISVLSGETNAVSAALGEVSEHVRAGKLKVLLITEDSPVKDRTYANIPLITELYPESAKYFPSRQWLGFAVPKDTPQAVITVLEDAFQQVMNDPETDKFMDQQYMEKLALSGQEANEFALGMEANLSWISQLLGFSKIDPAKLNIPKPAWMK